MASGLYIEHQRDYHIGRWLFTLVLICMLSLVGWFAYHWYTTGEQPPIIPLPASALADTSVNENPLSQADIENHKVPTKHPRYISIPSLGVDKARVQSVGLTQYKTLAMPKNILDAGWYKESAFPGQGYGAVLLDGHSDGVSRDGIFAKLSELKNGDEIIIERGDGKKLTYTVVENQTESIKDANTTGMQRLLTPYDETAEGLGIIATTGKWIPRDKVFDKRVLIRAVVAEQPQEDNADKAQAKVLEE